MMSWRDLGIACFALTWLVLGELMPVNAQNAAVQKPAAATHPVSRKLFAERDTNKDDQLTVGEFSAALPEGKRPAAQREYLLLDRNKDGQLSFDEFRNAAHIIPFNERGFIADPVIKLVDAEMKKFDENISKWDTDDNGDLSLAELSQSSFFLIFERPFITRRGSEFFITKTPNGPWMDRDKNGGLSRDEVRYALEVSYGVRRWQGELIRSKTGRIHNWVLFRHVDENRNESVGRFEYINRANEKDKETAEANFDKADTDKSLALSFVEWCGIAHQQVEPFWLFLDLDVDLDGKVSPDELRKGTLERQAGVAKHIFPGFDLDKDGFLSVDEFLVTPLVDQMYPWHEPIKDENGDDKLSREEFVYEVERKIPIAGGLLALYFDRYDVNADGVLTHDEFVFNTPKPQSSLYRMRADGTELELLVNHSALGRGFIGSPDVSPDGKHVAFDFTPVAGTSLDHRRTHVWILTLEGPDEGKLSDFTVGSNPDWSWDGTRLAYSQSADNAANAADGIWVMSLDRAKSQRVAPRLQNPRWSPDGKLLLCTSGTGAGRRVFLVDVESAEQKQVLTQVRVMGQPDWEPRGKRVVAPVFEQGECKLRLIDVANDSDVGTELWKTKFDIESSRDKSRPNWSSDGQEIVFSKPESGQYELQRITIADPSKLQAIRPAFRHEEITGVWSRNRDYVIFASTQPPEEIAELKVVFKLSVDAAD